MTKRQKLDFNSEELTQNLKTSTGQGMNAFFTPSSPPPPQTLPKKQKQRKKDKAGRASKHARTQPASRQKTKPASTQTSKDTSTQIRTDASVHARVLDELRRVIVNKKHLSSFTFRFKSEELEALDQVSEEISHQATGQRISKNDIVRLSLNWLLQDYEKNKQTSVLARVLTQV